jgi:hypothetical protein
LLSREKSLIFLTVVFYSVQLNARQTKHILLPIHRVYYPVSWKRSQHLCRTPAKTFLASQVLFFPLEKETHSRLQPFHVTWLLVKCVPENLSV